jgi:hypothetical protein
MAKTLFDAEIGFRVEVCLNLVPCAGAIGWRKAGGATPGPLVQQWASCLTAHVGSDPVHQETGTLRLDQPFGREYTIGAQKLPFLNEAARHAVSEALAQRQARPSGQSLIRPCAGKLSWPRRRERSSEEIFANLNARCGAIRPQIIAPGSPRRTLTLQACELHQLLSAGWTMECHHARLN